MILLQAITDAGEISANWVLIGITSAFGILVSWVLLNVRKDLKDGQIRHEVWLQEHEEKISNNTNQIKHNREMFDLRLENISNGEEMANKIAEKLRAMQ